MDNKKIDNLGFPPMAQAILDFVQQVDSLADTLPLTRSAIKKANDLFSIETKNLPSSLEGLSNDSYKNQLEEIYKTTKKYMKFLLADQLVQRSFIISLITLYDAFLGKIIRASFLMRPEKLNASEKIITFSQLQTFSSIEDAKEYLIEKEIDTVLRKSHSEQLEWLEKKYGELRKELSIWPIFIEITERRNLFVHTGGKISNQYLNVCKDNNVNLPQDTNIDTELNVTLEYFKTAYECLLEIGIKLAHILWRRLQPDDRKNADLYLDRICYDLLLEERFELACTLLDFAVGMKRHSDDKIRRRFIINRAQAYKWSGKLEEAKKIICNEDWSATSDLFKLAEAVILDNFDIADKIVRKIGRDDEIGMHEYRNWPLFKEYRKSEKFAKIFEEIFEEALHVVAEDSLFIFDNEPIHSYEISSETLETINHSEVIRLEDHLELPPQKSNPH